MKYYKMRNNKGDEIQVPGNWTIKDLVERGFTNIGLHKRGEPIADNFFVEFGEVTTTPHNPETKI